MYGLFIWLITGYIRSMFTLMGAFVEYSSSYYTQVKPFCKHLYNANKPEDESAASDCVPVQICGKDPVSSLCMHTCM